MLLACLGPDAKFFAKCRYGAGTYVWMLEGDNWHQLSKADPIERSEVQAYIEARRLAIAPKLKPQIAQNVFTYPSDDNVYYRYNDAGQMEVVLTAWDFKVPARQIGGFGPENYNIRAKQDVCICFMECGKPSSNTPFSFVVASGNKRALYADGEGRYDFKGLVIGDTYTLIAYGKSFSLTPEKGVSEFVVDVTRPLSLAVSVRKDGACCVNEPVTVILNGGSTMVNTDASGCCSFEFPYTDSRICIVKTASEQKEVELCYPHTDLEFAAETPCCNVIVDVTRNGKPLAYESVVIRTPSGAENVMTNVSGRANLRVPYAPGLSLITLVRTESQTKVMVPGDLPFQFSLSERIPTSLKITVEGEDGSIKPNYPVVVTCNDKVLNIVTDDCGVFSTNLFCSGDSVLVSDGNDLNNKIEAVLSEDPNSLVLKVANPSSRPIHITVLDAAKLPVAGAEVQLSQNDKNANIKVDDNGRGVLSRGIFASGVPVNTFVLVNDTRKGPFSTVFDDIEDEYTIILDTRYRRPWLAILGMIALILLFVAINWLVLYVVLV